MGKHIRVFFVLLLTCIALFGAPNYMQQLEQYDTQMKGANNDEVLRVFHGLKAVYIQAIISGDENLKKETLERLIKTAKVLKLDASKYESELATLGKDTKKTAPSKPLIPPPAAEESFEASRSTTSSNNNAYPSAPQASTQAVSAKENKADAMPMNATTTQASSSSLPKNYNGKNVLQHVKTSEEEIVLDFGSAVVESSVKIFVLKTTDGYKKIIDIPAIIMNAPLTITTPKKLQSLRISQYNANAIRIILDAPSAFETYVSVLDTQVILSLNKKPVLTEKRIMTPAVEAPKKAPVVAPPPEQPSAKSYTAPTIAPEVPVVASKATPSSPSKKGQKRDKTIVIDAGHGGKDAGAIGYKQRMEKNLVLDMALQLGKELKSRGYKVFYTRQSDEFINLRDRTKVANDKNADLFISIHANAAPNEAKKLSMKGLETFFLSPDRSERSKNVAALENQSNMEEMDFYSKETFLNVFNREKIILSNKVAIDIQSSMLKSVKKKYSVEDGGVREAPFWVLVGATMPSVLIEVGYISNPDESDNMFNPQYQKHLVDGISDGLDQYFTNNP
jgi:N-acetylmuramoyl-L-alanine amidase